MLRTEAPIRDEEELLMSARDLLDTGSPRLAVVEAQTAFELVVNRLVADHYRTRAYPNKKIAAILDSGFKNVIKDHLNAALKPFAEGMPEYDNWLTETYEPRCDLVHGERLQVTEEEAEQAIRRVEEALEYLTGRPHDRISPPERPPICLT